MLDVVFINLISAGLERLCRKTDDRITTTTPRIEESVVLRDLIAVAPTPAGQLINRSVEDIWAGCRAVGLPSELAEPHLAALPGLIHQSHLRPADHDQFLEPGIVAPANAMRDLAQRIISTGNQHIELPDAIDETVLAYLLETFLTSLHASRALVQELRPQITERLAPALPEATQQHYPLPVEPAVAAAATASASSTASTAAVTLAKIERADALGITVPLLEVITVTLINLAKSPDIGQADLLAAAADTARLDETLVLLSEHATELALADGLDWEQVLTTFRAGRLRDCDRQLGLIEDDVVRRSVDVTPHDDALSKLAVEVRALRAGLHRIAGSFVKAARHYGFAQRYIPRTDAESRWHYARLEADHYELAAYHHNAPNSLENAARACTGALAAIPDDQPPSLIRATAQAGLAHILMLLGERDRDPARFELAAQLLSDANAYFDTEALDAEYGVHVVILRADALTRLGELHRNSELLEQAAMLLQSMTGKLAAPNVTAAIRTRLALALASYAELENQTGMGNTALTTVREELGSLASAPSSVYGQAGFTDAILAARCHLALAAASEAGPSHIENAARCFEAIGFHDRSQALRGSLSGAGSSPEPEPPELTKNSNDGLTDNEANAA